MPPPSTAPLSRAPKSCVVIVEAMGRAPRGLPIVSRVCVRVCPHACRRETNPFCGNTHNLTLLQLTALDLHYPSPLAHIHTRGDLWMPRCLANTCEHETPHPLLRTNLLVATTGACAICFVTPCAALHALLYCVCAQQYTKPWAERPFALLPLHVHPPPHLERAHR